MTKRTHNIGIFDSGFGGLSILKEIKDLLPQYNYVYLGDNARAPYGTRSFETVYQYTLQAVKKLIELDCHLIIIACNTASAKALRSIQQNDLPYLAPDKRVLGIIRPCTEQANTFTNSNNLGIFATNGTVLSKSYEIEINKFFPHIKVNLQACPMWVPIIENGEALNEGADYFVKKEINNLLKQNPNIDNVLLACTHYPILLPKIRKYLPDNITITHQGTIVAKSLKQYLQKHPEIESLCGVEHKRFFYTTDSISNFDLLGSTFLCEEVNSRKISL